MPGKMTQPGARDRLGGGAAAGDIHQRIGVAVDHGRGGADCGERLGAVGRRDHRAQLAGAPGGVDAALEQPSGALALVLLLEVVRLEPIAR